jgi:filamentous hemagglutinin
MDAVYAAKTDRTILADNNFDMAHVLTGEINDRGRATGYHAEIAANGEARITPGATVTQNANGTYEAPVQIWDGTKLEWVSKKSNSTFFPLSWSEARITYEVSEAFKTRSMLSNQKWRATTPSGIVIEGFTNAKRTTFYPTENP